jgi:hypothetical protein
MTNRENAGALPAKRWRLVAKFHRGQRLVANHAQPLGFVRTQRHTRTDQRGNER